MYQSILQFCEKGTFKLDEIAANFVENPKDFASFAKGVSDVVLGMGLDFMGETLERLDEMIRDSELRKQKYEIVRRDRKITLTSLGNITYKKTLYKHKKTGKRTYLLDKVLEFDEKVRITEDAEAKLLEEAVETSYRKAGNAVSILDNVSKATVKNKIHDLKFPEVTAGEKEEKKKIKYLYIDADEDHVPLQFFSKKGDTRSPENAKKRNTVQVKLVYVYEGIERESPKGKRYKLINPKYFCGVYEGKENKRLWEDVNAYIEATYDTGGIEKIYLNSDGGGWIKEGKTSIFGVVSVLDEYHINKYLTSMTSHLFDSKEDGKDLLREAIRKGSKAEFIEAVGKIVEYAETDADEARIRNGEEYILNNWTASKNRLRKKEGIVGSSTEGHVSHVLASRMSSRPLGWCKQGADAMGRLRAYSWNGGDMLALVRYQKKEKKKVSGDYDILTAADIKVWERANRKDGGVYLDKIKYSLPAQVRRKLAIRERLLTI